MADLRAAVSALREGAALDLRPALAALAGSVSRPRVHLTVPEDLGLHDAARAHALFRCVQEIVTNAVRHARAENLWIALERNHGENALDPVLRRTGQAPRRCVSGGFNAPTVGYVGGKVREARRRRGCSHRVFWSAPSRPPAGAPGPQLECDRPVHAPPWLFAPARSAPRSGETPARAARSCPVPRLPPKHS